jgi:hypothetical protein
LRALKTKLIKKINSALLFMIRDVDDIDDLFWYLREEFLRVNKIAKN